MIIGFIIQEEQKPWNRRRASLFNDSTNTLIKGDSPSRSLTAGKFFEATDREMKFLSVHS